LPLGAADWVAAMSATDDTLATPPPARPGRTRGRHWLRQAREPGSTPRRAVITMVDQGFASASNFAVGIVVARVAGKAGFGAYAVAYSVWLVMGNIQDAIITDPMAIENDARQPDAADRLRIGIAAELAMGVVAAAIIAVLGIGFLVAGSHMIGIALLTVAPCIPFLLVQDYWRWVGFMQARPDRSLINDTVFNFVQAASLAVLVIAGMRSVSMAIAAWGIGAVAAAIYGLRQYSVRPTVHGGVAMMRSRWSMSKWLLASGIAGWGSSQAYPLLAGPAVGDTGLGGLKAAQSLISGPCLVLLQAGGSIGLPEASNALEHEGWGRMQRVCRWVTIAGVASVGLVAIVVLVAGRWLLDRIYGPGFGEYANTAKIVALAFLVQSFSLGGLLGLKASRNTRELFRIGVLLLVVSTIAMVAFSYAWGIEGTAWSMVVTAAVTDVALFRAMRRAQTEHRFAAEPNDSGL
jgi:O-antigen/teichoic acid export membrane protein